MGVIHESPKLLTPYIFKLDNLTARDIYTLFQELADKWGPGRMVVCLEEVHSMPKQGVASSFKFGRSFGLLEMAIIASRARYNMVTPNKWQTHLRCRTGGDKNVSKQRSQQLFPGFHVTINTADAILIAEYCRQVHR